MDESQRVLEMIEAKVVEHGGDLGGWTKLEDATLKLFAGRVTLRAEVREYESARTQSAHVHVLTTLHEHDDEVLDACVVGIGDHRAEALEQAAVLWITGVAGPIKSFLDDKPICMTCKAGMENGNAAQGYVKGDFGLPDLTAYVGPTWARGNQDEAVFAALDDDAPWFRYAAESVAPRRIHIAKSMVISQGDAGWRRELEIDGHDVAHVDPCWHVDLRGPRFGYLVRYAVFAFPHDAPELARRAELDQAVMYFIENFARYESIDELMVAMVAEGFAADLVDEIESISTIAFGRLFFEGRGIDYPATIIRARRDGRVETDVPLMSLPAYCRGRAVGARLLKTLPKEEHLAISLYSAESQVIVQALEARTGMQTDLGSLALLPNVVPERGTSDATLREATDLLKKLAEQWRKDKKKPWWKIW
ncbi:MAG: DUF6348 family protein [Pirellulales bacterium]